jgi:proline iminopeptidase
MLSAWELHRAWPEASLQVIPDAGHSMTEVGIRSALIEATDALALTPPLSRREREKAH